MNEQQIRDRLAAAVGEPPGAAAAVSRLEAALEEAPAHRVEREHPRGMALAAAVLTLVVVAGLLATQVARFQRTTRPPAPAPAASAPAPGCLASAPDQLIVVDVSKQRLVAYDHGCPFLTTPVTTGRTTLPSDLGQFQVRSKSTTFLMKSPWPKGNPYWYPDVTVHDYIAYGAQGGALHSAEWELPDAFGPGSEDGVYGTHGTVNVPGPALDRLYAWVDVGATVTVTNGG